MAHNIFTPGNYFYNGIGHLAVQYEKVLDIGYTGIIEEAKEALSKLKVSDGDYGKRARFLTAVIMSCQAAIDYSHRYAKLAFEQAKACQEEVRKQGLHLGKIKRFDKVRDAASAEGFAGYSLFQNLIAGGQDEEGNDVTNDLSFMCIEASMHVMLPAPSLSVRVWNRTPDEFLIKAAALTRTGIGLPAYYNDEAGQ
jgi:pyruvate-formate lyase